jgi:cysteine desulfurase/selenocysteine lyase
MISEVDFAKTTFAETPYKFEAGTQNISSVISLGEAIDYLTTIGMEKIQKNEHELLDYAEKKLQELPGINIYGSTSEKCGIISFNLQDIHHYDAMMILDKMGIAIRSGRHCADPVMGHYKIPGSLRASFALYNTQEDVDRLIKGLKKVQEMHR